MQWQKRFPIKRVFLSDFKAKSMKWQKRFLIKRGFLSENVCPISINLPEIVLKRLANQHRLQKTLSIGLEIERNSKKHWLKKKKSIK